MSNIARTSGVHPGAGRGVAQWRNTFTFLRCRGLARGILGHGRYLTSHMCWAGLGWADNSAHGDTARADDALTAAPHPSHHSCSVQFILMLIHAIDCGVEPGQWTRRSWGAPHVPVSVWVSSVLPHPSPSSPLCPDPASSELISNFTIFATVLPISLSAPR